MFCSHACVFAQNDNRKSVFPVNFVLPLISIFVRSSAQTNQRSTPATILFFGHCLLVGLKPESVIIWTQQNSCING